MAQEPPTTPSALADDEAALKQGKSGLVIVVGALGLALLAGLWLLMSGGDEARVHGDIGKKVNGLRQGSFDAFWGCALPGANLKDLKSNADLMAQLDGRASEGKAGYGVHLRDNCLDELREIEPGLDALIVPDALRADVDAMAEATSKLRGAVSAFVSYLDDPELRYDSEAAKLYVEAIARAWFDFRRAHAAINKALKDKLEAH